MLLLTSRESQAVLAVEGHLALLAVEGHLGLLAVEGHLDLLAVDKLAAEADLALDA